MAETTPSPNNRLIVFKGKPMPSESPAQHRLMEAAANTPGGVAGVPQSVGKDFAAADRKVSLLRKRGLISDRQAERKGFAEPKQEEATGL